MLFHTLSTINAGGGGEANSKLSHKPQGKLRHKLLQYISHQAKHKEQKALARFIHKANLASQTTPYLSQDNSHLLHSSSHSTTSATSPLALLSSSTYPTYVFWLFLCVVAFMVVYDSAFAVIDDHTLIPYLFQGHNIPMSHFISPAIGRYFPLDGQDLNILSALFSAKPYVFYGFNALCVLLVGFCLSYALRHFITLIYPASTNPHILAYILVAVLFLTPAFWISWLRLFVPERMEFVFLSIFLACYAHVASRHKSSIFILLIGIASASIALFYKETAFLLLGIFASCHILLSLINTRYKHHLHKRLLCFNIAICCACAIWVACYYVLIIAAKTTTGKYGDTLYNPLIVLLKTCFNYAMNEPFIFLLLPAIFIYRICYIYKHIRQQQDSLSQASPFCPLLDASLCSCMIFISAYIVLKLSNAYYMLPCYIFGLIAMGGILASYSTLCALWRKILLCVMLCASAIFLSNAIFYSIHTIAHYKGMGQNLQATLAFFSQQKHTPIRIMLDGVDCSILDKSEVCHSFKQWLQFHGIEASILSDTDLYNPLRKANSTPHTLPSTQAQVLESSALHIPTYLILTPYSSNLVNSAYIKQLDSRYMRVFHADWGYNIGLIGIKTWLKYLFTKDGDSSTVFSGNAWNLPIHFYIYAPHIQANTTQHNL